jgi:hypothetical protein
MKNAPILKTKWGKTSQVYVFNEQFECWKAFKVITIHSKVKWRLWGRRKLCELFTSTDLVQKLPIASLITLQPTMHFITALLTTSRLYFTGNLFIHSISYHNLPVQGRRAGRPKLDIRSPPTDSPQRLHHKQELFISYNVRSTPIVAYLLCTRSVHSARRLYTHSTLWFG